MPARTPVIKDFELNGTAVKIHACPWPLYRKIYGSKDGTSDTLGVIEEVVRECVEVPDGTDIVSSATQQQMARLFELAVNDDGNKPDF